MDNYNIRTTSILLVILLAGCSTPNSELQEVREISATYVAEGGEKEGMYLRLEFSVIEDVMDSNGEIGPAYLVDMAFWEDGPQPQFSRFLLDGKFHVIRFDWICPECPNANQALAEGDTIGPAFIAMPQRADLMYLEDSTGRIDVPWSKNGATYTVESPAGRSLGYAQEGTFVYDNPWIPQRMTFSTESDSTFVRVDELIGALPTIPPRDLVRTFAAGDAQFFQDFHLSHGFDYTFAFMYDMWRDHAPPEWRDGCVASFHLYELSNDIGDGLFRYEGQGGRIVISKDGISKRWQYGVYTDFFGETKYREYSAPDPEFIPCDGVAYPEPLAPIVGEVRALLPRGWELSSAGQESLGFKRVMANDGEVPRGMLSATFGPEGEYLGWFASYYAEDSIYAGGIIPGEMYTQMFGLTTTHPFQEDPHELVT